MKKKEITYEVNKNGCWICNSHKLDNKGYPNCCRNGHPYHIHRWMYMKHHNIDSLSSDVVIRHACDVPSCINPKHLLRGSHYDNAQDRVKRGRSNSPIGVKSGQAKLTEKQVLEIRANTVDSCCKLGTQYNISNTVVHGIRTRKSWKHLK